MDGKECTGITKDDIKNIVKDSGNTSIGKVESKIEKIGIIENKYVEKGFENIEKDNNCITIDSESDNNTENEIEKVPLRENNEKDFEIIKKMSEKEPSIESETDSDNKVENINNDTDDNDSDNDTEKQDTCRICYGNDDEEKLLAPCRCLGTVQYQHESCLLTWLKSGATQCELCNTNYRFKRIVKPYQEVSLFCILLMAFVFLKV